VGAVSKYGHETTDSERREIKWFAYHHGALYQKNSYDGNGNFEPKEKLKLVTN
jgi:hypothetical protein